MTHPHARSAHQHQHPSAGNHDRDSHVHALPQVSDRGLLGSVALNLGLTAFEVVAGIISGSVALLADALHNFNDCAALLVAYIARKVSRRRADANFTFGYRRAELIGAMINLTALIVVGLFLIGEAVRRFFQPEPLLGGWMMAAALIALVVDIVTAGLLWALAHGGVNLRAAFVHNLTDALASVAVLAGGAAVSYLDWTWVDPVLTLAIAGGILFVSVKMLRRTIVILMEGAPEDLDLAELQEAAAGVAGVQDLHHVHVWELDETHRALEGHVVVADEALDRMHEIKGRLKARLLERFGIAHTTLEFERSCEACAGDSGAFIPDHRPTADPAPAGKG